MWITALFPIPVCTSKESTFSELLNNSSLKKQKQKTKKTPKLFAANDNKVTRFLYLTFSNKKGCKILQGDIFLVFKAVKPFMSLNPKDF